MNILALDIGTKRTGVALSTSGTHIALNNIHHNSIDELTSEILNIINERNIDKVVLGLPLLLSGKEGSQVRFVRSVKDKLNNNNIDVILLDERFTTPKSTKVDPEKVAACAILTVYEDKINS